MSRGAELSKTLKIRQYCKIKEKHVHYDEEKKWPHIPRLNDQPRCGANKCVRQWKYT